MSFYLTSTTPKIQQQAAKLLQDICVKYFIDLGKYAYDVVRFFFDI
jgi:hypothetical protein